MFPTAYGWKDSIVKMLVPHVTPVRTVGGPAIEIAQLN